MGATNPETVDQIELSMENVVGVLRTAGESVSDRWAILLEDEEAKQGLLALARVAVNSGYTLADMVPMVGQVVSNDWVKLGAKIFPELGRFDSAPDVSAKVALLTEGLDMMHLDLLPLPSHAIELALQTAADLRKGNIQEGLRAVRYLMVGDMDYAAQLVARKQALDAAVDEFN